MKSPHLVIKKNLWHFRLFIWSLAVVDRWLGMGGAYKGRYEFGISIPRYVVTIAALPFILASNALFYLQIWLIFILIPFSIGGLTYLGYLALVVLSFLLLIVASLAWTDNIPETRKKIGLAMVFRKLLGGLLRNVNTNITFADGD